MQQPLQYLVGDVEHGNSLTQVEGDSLLVLTIRNYHKGRPGVINLKHRIMMNIETFITVLQPPVGLSGDRPGTDNNVNSLFSIWYKDEDTTNIALYRKGCLPEVMITSAHSGIARGG